MNIAKPIIMARTEPDSLKVCEFTITPVRTKAPIALAAMIIKRDKLEVLK